MGRLEYDEKVRTYCPSSCVLSCGMFAYVKDGRVVKIEPAPIGRKEDEHICAKGLTCIQGLVYHPDRLKYPLKRMGKRGEGKWQRISWDEALDFIAHGFQETREKYGSKAIMGFDGLLVHALGYSFAGRLANLLECTYAHLYTAGDSAGPIANLTTYGSFGGGHETKDTVNSKFFILWGLNPAETQPIEMRDFLDAKERGTKLVVIDPRFTPTAAKADWWIPIRPGTDGALALGMAKVIIDRNLYDEGFIIRFTVGPFLVREDNGLFLREKDVSEDGSDGYVCWDIGRREARLDGMKEFTPALRGRYNVKGIPCRTAFQCLLDKLEEYTLSEVSKIAEVPEETIEKLALEYAKNKPAGIKGFWGLQRTFHGHINVRAIHLLGILTGNIGIPGGGVSDFQIPTFTPDLELPDERRARFVSIPAMHKILVTGEPYPIKAFFILGSYLTQKANTNKLIHEVFPKLDLIVVFDLFMTPTAEHADIVLPGATTFESTEFNRYPFPYVQLAPKVIEPLYESKSDFWVFKELARRMGLGEYFDMTEEEFIGKLLESPQLRGITLEDLREGPVKIWKSPDPYVTFEDRRFLTPSGRIEFYSEKYAKVGEALPLHKEPLESSRCERAKQYPLIFFSTHTRWRWHSCFQNAKWLRELNPEPVLQINPQDAQVRSIGDGDPVIVFNDRGRCIVKARVTDGIRPGLVNIEQGWWPKNFVEGSHQHLTHDTINEVQEMTGLANIAYLDTSVEVKSWRDNL